MNLIFIFLCICLFHVRALAEIVIDDSTVTVQDTSFTQRVYLDDPILVIEGSNFNPVGNTLRFANGILGKGLNYSTVSTTANKIILRLTPGSSWWRKASIGNLPAALPLLGINAGKGFISMRTSPGRYGWGIAMVFERPIVLPSSNQRLSSTAPELRISGEGFPLSSTNFTPRLKFNPPLMEGIDYVLQPVVSKTELILGLLPGRQWRSTDGFLELTDINTRNDETGWIGVPSVRIADIIVDTPTTSKDEQVDQVKFIANERSYRVYQSALNQKITIKGEGFFAKMELTLFPALTQGKDFTIEYINQNQINLVLVPGTKWMNIPGKLFISEMKVNRKVKLLPSLHPVKTEEEKSMEGGVFIAMVLEDPTVWSSKLPLIRESQTHLLQVYGTGFKGANGIDELEKEELRIKLDPTPAGNYRILSISNTVLKVVLSKPDASWLPFKMRVDGEKEIALTLRGIDTGAGWVSFEPAPIVVSVIADLPGVLSEQCRDSCPLAFDGHCDDNNNTNDSREDGCTPGTDCTDCGGADSLRDVSSVAMVGCSNTCWYSRDGVCDDPRGGRDCVLGTDCQDCGPVGATNFTGAGVSHGSPSSNEGSSFSSSPTPTTVHTDSDSPSIGTFRFLLIIVFWSVILFRGLWYYFSS